MAKNKKLKSGQPELFVEYNQEIDHAYQLAVRHALLKHKQAGNPVAIWRDGKVVLLSPDEILLEKEAI